MKKLILSVSAIVGFSMVGFSQGVQFAGNVGLPDNTIAGVVNTTQDLNLQLLEGSSAGTATTVLATLLNSDGTSSGDVSTFGFIYDNSAVSVYNAPAGTDFFQVLAWSGQYTSYAAALASGKTGEFAGASVVFSETIPVQPPATPPALTGIGVINLTQVPTTVVPEPSTLAMAGVGLASMLFFRRRNK